MQDGKQVKNLSNPVGTGKFLNESGFYQLPKTLITLAAIFPSTVVTRANVTGMSFNVIAGKKYEIDLLGTYQSAALTTGGSIGFVLTSGTGTIFGVARMANSVASNALDSTATIYAISSSNTLAGSFLISNAQSIINTPHYVQANLVFTCATNGVFQLQFATEIAASAAQLNAGLVMIVQLLN